MQKKKAVGRVHETGRIPFFLFRVTIAGTVAGLARRAVGYRPPRAFPGPPGAPPEPPRGAPLSLPSSPKAPEPPTSSPRASPSYAALWGGSGGGSRSVLTHKTHITRCLRFCCTTLVQKSHSREAARACVQECLSDKCHQNSAHNLHIWFRNSTWRRKNNLSTTRRS